VLRGAASSLGFKLEQVVLEVQGECEQCRSGDSESAPRGCQIASDIAGGATTSRDRLIGHQKLFERPARIVRR
jgi:hypothetical protein